MRLGVIADDFTGASDIANTLSKGAGGGSGLSTVQFLGIPTGQASLACEAGVISLKTRSIPVKEAVAQSLAACEWLRSQGCTQIVFKYCSTFDSTSAGNIGPVAEALADALDVKGVVACPSFPAAGRTVFQGHLFVGDRLLSESNLATHPLNPMTDPDIRRWLQKQTKTPVGLVTRDIVSQGPNQISKELREAGGRGETLVIVDAITNADLIAIGEACADAPFLTGGSGVALGLPRNFIADGRASVFRGVKGPEAILAGSCSRATLVQIEMHRRAHPSFPVSVDAVMAGEVEAEDLVRFVHENEGRRPLVYSSDSPEQVAAGQARYGTEGVAHALEALFARTASHLVGDGIRRLVVAGGETSGAVVSRLGLESFEIGPEIDLGVPVLLVRDGSLGLVLKSGNFGGIDFFQKALNNLEGA